MFSCSSSKCLLATGMIPKFCTESARLSRTPWSVQREYWRLFTALFLHGGFLHCGFNIFALYVLGPPLERAIGTMRFVACYLISGLASSAGVVALTVMGLVQVVQVIGASGCIMGIVGAWAGFLLRHHHAPLARQRLANIGYDRRDPDRIRSFDSTDQHGRASVRIGRRIFPRADACATGNWSRGR